MSYTTATTQKQTDLYIANDTPTDKMTMARKYAYMRTVAGTTNERLRPAYEEQVNRKLEEAVAKEKAYMQTQVDRMTAEANEAIKAADAQTEKFYQEALTWEANCKAIYEEMLAMADKANAEIARLEAENGRVKKEVKRLRALLTTLSNESYPLQARSKPGRHF